MPLAPEMESQKSKRTKMVEKLVKNTIVHVIIFLSVILPIERALAHAKLLKSDPPQRSEIKK